jgi:hypothetical protein
MTAATSLVIVGLVLAVIGAGVALRARSQPRPAVDPLAVASHVDGPVDSFDDVLERAHAAFRATDSALRIGVAVIVAGLLLAGIGAYLGSDARALGADVGGSGTSDRARVGGSW